jgi:DNA replication protein DnaC
MNRRLVFDLLATGAFIARHEDALFLGPPGSGKSHLAQAIGQAAIQQGYRGSIVKPTLCSMSWRKLRSMARAKNTCSFW